jgi:hypothetical protein
MEKYMEEEYRHIAIMAVASQKSDDAYRAQMAFSKYTKEQMQEEHGQSGRSRQQILDEYLNHNVKMDKVIAWLRSI